MHLQNNIGVIREHHRLTYQEFGDRLGFTIGAAKSYELKGTVPPINILCKIADFADISLDVLIREKLTSKNYLQHQNPHAFLKQIEEFGRVAELFNNRLSDINKRAKRT